MQIKLFDSELKIMNIVWAHGEATAKQIADQMEEDSGWSKATTYTLIKRCIGKGAIERSEPNYVCRPLIEKKDIQALETESFLQKMFNGAADQLIVSLLSSRKLSKEEIKALKEIINELE